MNNATIAGLTQIALRFREARNWKQFHNPKELAISLCLEAAEVLEHMQWQSPAVLEEHLLKNSEELADELADVLHSVFLLAHDLKIDLGKSFKRKMKKNEAKYPIAKAKGMAKKYTQL